jgi:hypothetical protein
MNAPLLRTASEGEAIVALIAARLDRLSSKVESAEAIQAIRKADAAYQALPGGGALTRILALFGATEADRAVMLTCLAPEFDPTLLMRYNELTGRAWATEWLASILFARPGQMLQGGNSALLRWQLVAQKPQNPGEPPALTPDPAIRAWLASHFEIPLALSGKARFVEILPPLAGWPVAETAAKLRRVFERRLPVLMSVAALEGAGRASFAAKLAEAFGLHTIAVDPGAGATPWTSDDTATIQRLALVANAALLWRAPPPAGSLAPPDRTPPLLQIVTVGPGETAPEPVGLAPFHVRLPPMPPSERAHMIAAAVPTAAGWRAETRALLATREALTPGAIARLAHIAPETDAEAIQATNATQAAVMGSLAERMTGELGWDDLILPGALAEDLRDFAYEARTRREVWGNPETARLFARERGLVGLFHGPSGTGKTMAAQVMARDMGVDLYRIDCGAVISKYIGETAKNLAAIFARARQIDAVLFFDEADALFSRRTDVKDSNDRHANADTAYLLQLIEGQFEGTALLATNRKSDMDAAFLRRIRYSFEFPRPSPEARTAIWQRASRALTPARAQALVLLWPVLGAALDLTGAQIKTTLLAAHFAAGRQGAPLGAAQILRAAERELMKEGRALGARDRERISAHA